MPSSSRLVALRVDANDPERLAAFWSGLLGWEADGLTLRSGDGAGFLLRFVPNDLPKVRQNQMHLDLTSTSPEDQQRTVARALELGGRYVDVGQGPEEPHVVLGDPEGNEFCVVGPGNAFLAGCGFVGAVACDGSQQEGYFWSAALGWPLVWDQDEETAIQSPHGGTKISWGGPPVNPKTGKNRWCFEVAPAAPEQRDSEVERLVSLGATRIDPPFMASPDGNEFWVGPA